jgi:hypothetical protein
MNTLSAELVEMLEVVRALNFAADDGAGHWITMGGSPGPEGQHTGGSHVKIDGSGKVEAGPKSLEGQNVEHLKKHPLYDKKTGQVFKKKAGAQDLKGVGPRIKQLQEEARRKGQNLTFNQALAQAKAEKEAGKMPAGPSQKQARPTPKLKQKQPDVLGKAQQELKKIEAGTPTNALPQADVSAAFPDVEMEEPKAEPEKPQPPPSSIKSDLFGKSFIDSSGVGEQKPLFHQPVAGPDKPKPEFSKFKESDTPEMFPAKGEGAPKGEQSNEQPAGHPDEDRGRAVEGDNGEHAAGATASSTGDSNGPTEPPEKPVAAATPDEPDRGDEPAVPASGAERGDAVGTEGAEPDRAVEPPAEQPHSEQDVAQAVNRGEMGVDDVLQTHPHLAGDALIEQHKRERDEEQARAQAEQEAEDAQHAQGSEADLPEGELPDFGDEAEGEQAPAEPQPEAESQPEPEPEVPTRQPARNNKAPTRSGIEKMLLDNLSAVGGGYTVEDEHTLNEAAGAGNPFTFHKEIPAEVKDFIAGHPEAQGLRKLFRVTNNPAEAGGADAFGQLGDRYFNIAEAKAGTPIRQALQEAKNSPDPQVRLLAAIYELPKGETKGRPQSVNPQKLETGSKFTIKGVPVEVVKDENGHRSLKDGGEIPEVPIDALTEALPVDKGSVEPGKSPWENQPTEAPAAAPGPPKEPEAPEAAPAAESTPEKPQTQVTAQKTTPSPEELQADVQNGLAVLGVNPRQAESLARAAIQMGHTTVADAIKWALKNPTAKPPAPAPAPAAQAPASRPAVPPPGGMQGVRQRARTTPPPSNLPPLQHQGPPAKVPRNAQSVSALASSKPAHVGGPNAKGHATHMPLGRAVHAPAAPPVGRFIQSKSHLGKLGGHVRTPLGIHEQSGDRGPQRPHAGRGISDSEKRKAKGRTLQEMGNYSADAGSADLARMLLLLEMVS